MLNIDEPKPNLPKWALWQLGFRPLFLAGALLATLFMPIWLQSWYWPQSQWLSVTPLWWHPHELLFGFAMAIVAGFLLTAVQTWTNQGGMKGGWLMLTVGCWLIARLLLLLPVVKLLWLPALFDTLFLLLAAFWMGRSVIRVRQWRNIAFTPLLLLAAMANLLSYWALVQQNMGLAYTIWLAMLWWLVLMMTLVGGRVIPFFTSVRLGFPKPEPLRWVEWPLVAITLLLILQVLTGWFAKGLEQLLLLAGGLLHLLRMARWSGHRSLGEPLLWSLHLSYLCIPLTMLGMATFVEQAYIHRQLIHLLAVGAMGGMCLAMMTRVSLGHTGREIYKGPWMAPAFALIVVSALIRGLLPAILPIQTQLWHFLSGAGWTLAFGLFVFHFMAILNRPRVDGRPG